MNDNRVLLLELASIVYKRNCIDKRRCSALNKIYYYSHIKALVQSKFRKCDWQYKPAPKRWVGRVSELNKLILKAKHEYVKGKYDHARLTCSTHKRVTFLTKKLDIYIGYDNGHVDCLRYNTEKFTDYSMHIERSDFEALAKEWDAMKAVENMLKGKYDK